ALMPSSRDDAGMTPPKVAIPSTDPSALAGSTARSASPWCVPSVAATGKWANKQPSSRPTARAIRFDMCRTSFLRAGVWPCVVEESLNVQGEDARNSFVASDFNAAPGAVLRTDRILSDGDGALRRESVPGGGPATPGF